MRTPFAIRPPEEPGDRSFPAWQERSARLIGGVALERLRDAHVAVFGLGGVGSWAAEALVRAGIGRLTLLDRDVVSETDINRQLLALTDTLGAPKSEVVAARLRRINPEARIDPLQESYEAESAGELLSRGYDVLIDAIDTITHKAHLLVACHERDLPVVTCLGAGGRLDATRTQVAPFAQTHSCPLARELRKLVKRRHGVDVQRMSSTLAVFSDEPARSVQPPFDMVSDPPAGVAKRIEGTMPFVPPVFGFVAASVVVRMLAGVIEESPSAALRGRPIESRGPRP